MDAKTKEVVEVLLIKGKFKIAQIAAQMELTYQEVLEVARAKKSKESKQKCAQ